MVKSAVSPVRDAVEADDRVQVLADLGNRLVIEMPFDLIKTHPDLERGRASDPNDIEHLTSSVRRNGDTVYMISLYCELGTGDKPRYYVGDGHQRYRALSEIGKEVVHAQVILSWLSPADAMKDGVRLNTARYQLTDNDIMEVAASGLMTAHDLADASGKSVQSVERYARVAAHDYLRVAVKEKFIGYVPGSKLIEECKSKPERIEVLKRSFLEVYEKAEREASQMKNKIRADRGRVSHDPKTRQKQHMSFYGKQQDWGLWAQLIEDDDFVERDGQKYLNLVQGSKVPMEIYIGDEKEWEETVALGNFANRKWSEIDPGELAKLAEQWDWIGKLIRKHCPQLDAPENDLRADSSRDHMHDQFPENEHDHDPDEQRIHDQYARESEDQEAQYFQEMEPAGEEDQPDHDDQEESASSGQP